MIIYANVGNILKKNRHTMKLTLSVVILLIVIIPNIKGQYPFEGNYYVLDSTANQDSTNYYLRYYEFTKYGELTSLIFPITMIRSDWAKSDEDRFNFKDFNEGLSGKGKVITVDKSYYCNIPLSKGFDLYSNESKKYVKELEIRISYVNDSTICMDSQLFKKDSHLKIFQRFTGY
jgi:hypothetical protein